MTGRGDRVGTITGVRIAGPGSELLPGPGPYDVFLADDAIADIAPAGAMSARGVVLDGGGGWLLPGLWDHHVHVTQWALRSAQEPLGDARSAAQAARRMADVDPLSDGRRVGTGFRDGLWPDAPSLEVLDAATGSVPTYLVNADLHSVWLNSAALRREGMSSLDGMLREGPAFEISRRLGSGDTAMTDALVERMGRRAAARGVVGVVDLDLDWGEASWQRRTAAGFDALRVAYGIYPSHLDEAVAAGLRTGDRLRGAADDLVRVGPLKIMGDGSLGTRTAACSHPYVGGSDAGELTFDTARLTELMTRAAGAGLACAVHAIGDVANGQALDGFAATGAWGSIEHAQLVAHADLPRFARLGVAASVQPEHALDDRDMTDRLWADQTALTYPLRSLHASGASLRLGSDAPVATLDPWVAMAAAVFRARGDREAWRPEESLPVDVALAAATAGGSASPSTVAPGSAADLVVCESDPTRADEETLRTMAVRATLVGGRLTHLA